MSKPIKRIEQFEKKIDVRVKDRGDSKTFVPKLNNNLNIRTRKHENNVKLAYPDGDSGKVSTNTKQEKEKPKVNIVIKLPTREETKTATDTEDSKLATHRKMMAKEAEKKAVMELKRIREKYPMKVKSLNVTTNQVRKEDAEKLIGVRSDMKNFPPESLLKPLEILQSKENDNTFETIPKNSSENKDKNQSNAGRKPVIKTVTAKNTSLPVYKAVTFVEQKRKKTELNISIPNPETCVNKQNVSKCTDTSSLAPVNVTVNVRDKQPPARRKSPRRREFKKSRRVDTPSPVCDFRNNRSPSTEVAKWAPSSVNQETQPYYEAWVNTTLAASMKAHDKSYFNEQEFVKSFKKALERPPTPDLFYSNFADERYTGRIKIRQK